MNGPEHGRVRAHSRCNRPEPEVPDMNDLQTGGSPYEQSPFYWLAHTHAIYTLEMEKVLKKLGTDMPTRRVLLMLELHGTASVSELSSRAIIKMSTVTRILQRMRDDGLVETRSNADDARVTDVSMTPKGAELAQHIREATEKVYARGYKGLTDAQLDTLRKTLAVIFHNYADY